MMALGACALPLALWAEMRGPAGGAKPLVITSGGVYSGTWESNNARLPVILIQTAEPVTIENSTLRGRGNLIQTAVPHAQITVRNTHGVGMNPNAAGLSPGRFLSAESFDSIIVENNELDGTAGIYLLRYSGDFASNHTIKIVGNRVRNIDGRRSNGAGGYSKQTTPAQFVQLDQVRRLAAIDIAWNEVSNEPGESGVEDVISIYKSSGTADSPIRIHDNFIHGAYPADPASKDYSGGGIMLGDGAAGTVDDACAYVEAFANQVLDTTNYGVAISAGHDLSFHDNRILSTGLLPNGHAVPAQNVGAYIWDTNHDAKRTPSTFFNNSGSNNLIGWNKAGGRNDWWTPDATSWENNTSWPGRLTLKAEHAERVEWERKLKANGIALGIQKGR